MEVLQRCLLKISTRHKSPLGTLLLQLSSATNRSPRLPAASGVALFSGSRNPTTSRKFDPGLAKTEPTKTTTAKQTDDASNNTKSSRSTSGINLTGALLAATKRSAAKKKSSPSPSPFSAPMSSFKVKALTTAESYDLEAIAGILLKSGAYETVALAGEDEPLDSCLCVKAKYREINEVEARHVFFFENGCLVFWNVSLAEQHSILTMLELGGVSSFAAEDTEEHSENMQYVRVEPDRLDDAESSALARHSALAVSHFGRGLRTAGLIKSNLYFLQQPSSTATATTPTASDASANEHILEKYAFSEAISLSVKLGVWEQRLEEFTEKIWFISNDMTQGSVNVDHAAVTTYAGELFKMRHLINLQLNFLDTPDFYWDREELGSLYEELYRYLSIAKRTRLFNERLTHCMDIMEVVRAHVADKKHTRLEYAIIFLIFVEVLMGAQKIFM